MKNVIITCDRCGKDITNDSQYHNEINLNLRYWHGGSMGGEEDIDRLHCDICGDCARSLYYTFKEWLGRKEKMIKNTTPAKE